MKSKTKMLFITLTVLSLLTILIKAAAQSSVLIEQDKYLQKLRFDRIDVYLDKLN